MLSVTTTNQKMVVSTHFFSKALKKSILLLSVLFISLHAMSQTTFRKSYDIASFDLVGGMVENPAGEFVVAGTNATFIPLYGNITKLSTNGTVVWSKAFTGGIASDFWDIKNVAGGGYVAVGSSSGNGAVVVRIDDLGNLVWGRRITLPNAPSGIGSSEYATSVIQSSDGGFVVGGYVDHFYNGSVRVDTSSAWGFKLDNSGSLLWSRVWTIATANPDEHIINDVTETADGYFFVGSSSEGSGTLNSDGDYPRNSLFIKTDLSGNLVYSRRWGVGNTSSQGINSCITLANGNVLLGGYDDIHSFLISVAGTGATPTMGATFNRRFNGNGFLPIRTLIIQDIMQNSDGNYSIIGTHLEGNLIPTFYSSIYKINASTNAMIFARGYTSMGLSSILPEGGLCSDQGYFMTMTDQQITGFNYHTIRTDALGNMNDVDAGCPPVNLTVPTTTYNPTLTDPTPSVFTTASENTYTPVITNLNPTPTEHCLNVVCTPPAAPAASASPNPICAGQNTTLTASGVSGVTYRWYTVPSGGAPFASGPTTVVSPGTTTTYYVESDDNTNPGCVSSRTAVTVTVNPIPNVIATPNGQTICSGTAPNIALTSGVGGTTFSWTVTQSGATGGSASSGTTIAQTLTASGTSPGTVTYNVTPTAAGCTGTSTPVVVTVNPIPVGSATPNNQTICSGNATSIALNSNVVGTTFSWTVTQSGVSGATAGSGTSIAQTLNTTGASPGTATYTVTPTFGTCNGTAFQVTITVNPRPVVTTAPGNHGICSGTTTNIALSSTTAGTTYSWTVTQSGVTGASAGSGSTIAQTLTNAGTTAGSATYTITPSFAGCTGTPVVVIVGVQPVPNAIATPANQTICSGQATSIALSSSVTGTTFNWTVTQSLATGASAGSGTSIAQVLNTTGGTSGSATYTVVPTIAGCPGPSTPVQITINPTPDLGLVSATGTTICEGSSTTITATGTNATSFSVFDSPSGGTLLGSTPFTVSPSTTTTYYVQANNSNGCIDPAGRDGITITVIPIANPSWTSPGATCEAAGPINLNTLITGTAGGTWSGTGVSGNIFNPAGLSGSNVSITYSVGSAPCVQTLTQTISVQSAITATWLTPGTVCASGGPINLNTFVSGTAGGTWSGTGVTGNTFDPTGLSGSISITYSVGVPPCSDAQTNSIIVSPDVDPSWTSPGATCVQAGNINLNTLITGTAGGVWSGTGVTGNIFNPTGLAGQNISITYSVGTGNCVETSTQTITVSAVISGAWTSPGTMCESDGLVNLNSLVTGTAGGTWSGTGVTGNTFDPTGLSGTVNITYTVGVNPCMDVVTQSITINASPLDPTVTTTGSTICVGESTTINANGSGAGVTYNVYDAASGGNLVGTTSLTVSPGTTTTYFVQAQNANGCVNLGGVVPVTINVNPLPIANAGNNVTICPGSSTILTATGGGTYLWSTTETTSSINVSPTITTVYTVTVTNGFNCSASDSVIVSIYNTGSLNANNDSTTIENVSVSTLNPTTNDSGNPGTVTILGGPSHGTATVNGSNVIYTPNSGYVGFDTIYYQICDAFCNTYCDSAMIIYRVIDEIIINVPGGFSPNGDGINDAFVITGLEKYPENELYIYNRWGNLVYSSIPYNNDWRGESNNNTLKLGGEEVIDGTYFYILYLTPGSEAMRGSLELRRK